MIAVMVKPAYAVKSPITGKLPKGALVLQASVYLVSSVNAAGTGNCWDSG